MNLQNETKVNKTGQRYWDFVNVAKNQEKSFSLIRREEHSGVLAEKQIGKLV